MSHYSSEKQRAQLSAAQQAIHSNIPCVSAVDGWLSPEEAVELFSLVETITQPSPVVCEIGSWKGKSAYVLASALRKRNRGTLFCIDPFTGEGDAASTPIYQEELSKLDVSLRENFRNTMSRYALLDFVEIIPKRSEDARSDFPHSHIDVLFIDGNHEDEAVLNDYNLWAPLVVSGGYIAIHDVRAIHVTGPRKVYEQKIVQSSAWQDVRIIGEMAVAKKA